jgi:S-layer protein
MAIQGFDKEFYLNAKLAQLQSDSATAADWAGKDAAFLEARLLNGFGLTAEAHYEQYGYQEDLAPNAFFNPAEYIRAKATDMFNDPASTYLTIDEAAADFVAIWNGNVYNHYLQYGEEEGINPSNSFDVSAYLEAKLADLQAEEATAAEWAGKSVADVAAAFKDAGITALGHFTAYGQNEGLSAPAVPADEQVNVDTSVPGQVFTLTVGIDNETGTDGDDTFNATENDTVGRVLGGLDSIDGAAGNDTLNVADSRAVTATLTDFNFGGATIENVETINVTTNLGLAGLDVSGISGLEDFTAKSAAISAASVTAADTTNVDLTLATTNNSTVAGGQEVSVTKGAAAGTLGISGKALTDVTIKGGTGVVTIDNQEDSVAATANLGTTLKTVTLDRVDANTNIGGQGLEAVTVTGATTAARTVTITNAAANHALTVNVDGTGYQADGTTEAQTVVTDTNATSLTVNATGSKSSVDVSASTSAATVNITGTAALKLDAEAANVKTINGANATGNLNLGTINAATTAVTTGAGSDQFTLGAAKLNVDAGAGNDTVTLNGAIAAGSTINLGAGNDALLAAGGSVAASTATATTTVDGGDGFDTVSASLINAANAAQFVNFEALDLSATVTNLLDVELMTGSTIEALTLTGGASTNATVSNVAAGIGLTVSGDNSSGTTTIGVKGATAAASTDDSFAITFDGEAAATATATAKTAVEAGTVVLAGVENVSIDSTGEGFVANNIVVTAGSLQSLTITGDKDLDLDFAGTNGTNVAAGGGAVNLIDGSTATGELDINTANVIADNSSTGLTVKGGSADDTITLAQAATVDAGAGDDVITTAAATSSTLSGGAGEDSFVVTSTVADGATAAGIHKTTITDFAAGDSITGLTTAGDLAKIDLDSTVQSLDDAFGLLSAATDAAAQWFNYGQSTYLVYNDANAGLSTGDVVVELTGTHDLSNATIASGVVELA